MVLYPIIGYLRGFEFALAIVFSVPAALALGLLVGLIAWAMPQRPLSPEHRHWRGTWHRCRAGRRRGFVGGAGRLG